MDKIKIVEWMEEDLVKMAVRYAQTKDVYHVATPTEQKLASASKHAMLWKVKVAQTDVRHAANKYDLFDSEYRLLYGATIAYYQVSISCCGYNETSSFTVDVPWHVATDFEKWANCLKEHYKLFLLPPDILKELKEEPKEEENSTLIALVFREGEDDYSIWYPEVDLNDDEIFNNFLLEHELDGCSVRGTRANIVEELTESLY